MQLRPYQTEAIEQVRERLRRGARRCLIVLPTGGGKTVVAADIIRSATERGSRTLFLAHRRELIQQTADKLRRFGVQHGIIMAGERQALQHAVQVASIQTLARRRDALKHVDLIFFDEAHHAAASQYTDVLAWYPRARVVGLTATPWRLDGRGLADVFPAHVVARTPRQLRDEGFLVPVGGWEYEAIDTSRARVQRGDYAAKDLAEEALKPRVVGDVVEEWLRHATGKRTLVFAVSIEASQAMAARFRAAGVPAEHVDGEMATGERDAVLARLRSGKTLVICNCNVLTEGFDCPEIECICLCRPTLSTALFLQMVGRGTRPAPGKTALRLHDHAGCLASHGHPYAHRDFSPAVSAKGERDIQDTNTRSRNRCPACKSVRAGYPCDNCGFSPTPEELQLQYDAEAHRKAIAEDDSPKMLKRRKLALEYAGTSLAHKRMMFERFVEKHGPRKAIGIYRWWSGETEWPPRAWRTEGAEASL